MSIMFVGEDQVDVFAMLTVKSALKLYAKTGIKVNRNYTPSAMIRTASRMTGQAFKPRDYLGAVAALEAKIAESQS